MHPRRLHLFLLLTLVCVCAFVVQAQQPAEERPFAGPTPGPGPARSPAATVPVISPVAPPEPTPLPGTSPAQTPLAQPPGAIPRPPPPLPTPPDVLPAAATPALPSEPAQPAAPVVPPVEPYQPAFQLAEPVSKPPALRRLRLVLDGNYQFTAEQIRTALADQLSTIEQSGLSPALADDAAFSLGVYYRKNGFSQANVKWTIQSSSTLRLSIAEGPFTRLGNIVFQGNEHIPNATLFDYVTGSTRERFPDKKKPLPYIESDVNSGVERIRGLYQSEGYLDAVVELPDILLSPDKTRADVVIKIKEGTQYHFGKITFEGDIVFYPQRDLLKEMAVFTSKPYTPITLTNLERKIVYFYRTRGYFTAKVRSESDPAQAVNGYVAVKFIVEAGDVYRFDGVTQTGLKKLRADFLPKRFHKLKGQIYNPEKLEERYRQLMGTGLFTNLKLTQTPLPNHEVKLQFEVEEAKARELGFSVGYAKLEGLILGAHYTDRNLFGNGRPLAVDAEVAQKLLRGEMVYTDPWFLESDNKLNLRLYALTQDLDGYAKNETGLRPELSRKFGKHLELAAFALTRAVQITNNGIDPLDVGPTSYRADSLGVVATYDTRDSVLNPRRGFVVTATGDIASNFFGSSLEFLRGTGRASYYLPVGTGSLLAAGVRGGVIAPLDSSSDLPIDERFFNGGSRSVRSFSERTLGPKDSHGHPVGGELFTVANLEFVTPIRDNFDLALFADAGSTGRRLGSGFGQTGFALGPGLRYRLPIGPIRLDYGWNPVRLPNQPIGAIHFSFGFAF